MASDAERARELVAELLHLGRNCDVEVYSVELQRVSALLAQVRLEEASYWAEQLGAEWTRVDGSSSAKRLAELERAAGAGSLFEKVAPPAKEPAKHSCKRCSV